MIFDSRKIPQIYSVSFYRYLLKILAVCAYILILSVIFGLIASDHNNEGAADPRQKDKNMELFTVAEIVYENSKAIAGSDNGGIKMDIGSERKNQNIFRIPSDRVSDTIDRMKNAENMDEAKSIGFEFAKEIGHGMKSAGDINAVSVE